MFDYQELDKPTRALVYDRANEIRGLCRKTADVIRDIGLKLQDVKLRLGHGRFLAWLKLEFPEWNERTAERFMLVAEQFKSVNLSNSQFSTSALYLLSAPSTPASARHEAIALASEGERIGYTAAQSIVDRHKDKLAPKVADALACLSPEEQLRVIQGAEEKAVEEDDEEDDAPAHRHGDGKVTCPMCQGRGYVKPIKHSRAVPWPQQPKAG